MDYQWWHYAVIYQIYPLSFKDTSGDGRGDLRGIIEQLDYCKWLGVNALWIGPVYPSPMADWGYDVSDFTGIDRRFGTLEDVDELLEQSHRRGLKVLFDFVPNHSSDEHPWFVESASSRDNPRRDWYVWRDPGPDGGPPNNWLATFGGSAWQWHQPTGQYYLHSYLKEQPDVNWRNHEVKAAMFDVMRFWLDRGVDGFRVDSIARVVKDARFRDNPRNPRFRPGQNPHNALLRTYSADQPEAHDMIAEMRRLVDEYRDRILIGEAWVEIERAISYYGSAESGVHFPFIFQLIEKPWAAIQVQAAIDTYEGLLPRTEWPNWVLSNHDRPRVATRIGTRQARVAAMLLLTARGTPTLYYGDELGMEDVPIPPDRVLDPLEKRVPGLGLGRDPQRTPMQWNAESNAGFTRGRPWLPITDDYRQRNVAACRDNATSILALHRRLIKLRAEHEALYTGDYAPVHLHEEVVAYLRSWNGSRFLVALNLTEDEHWLTLRSPVEHGRIRLSTHLDREEELDGHLLLRGAEGVVVELASAEW